MTSLAIGPDSFVTLSYAVFGPDGEEVERATKEDPLTYVQGYGQIVPGLEELVAGLVQGDKRRADVSAEDAFGEIDEEARFEISRDELEGEEVRVGDELEAEGPDGDVLTLRVLEIRPETLLVDANHPLAGRTLTFDVEVLDVRDATDEEIDEAREELEGLLDDGGCCDDPEHHHGDHDHAHPHEHGSPELIQISRKTSS